MIHHSDRGSQYCSHEYRDIVETGEPTLIQVFVTETIIEALDIAVLHRLAGIDKVELYAILISPSIHDSAGHLRTIAYWEVSFMPPFGAMTHVVLWLQKEAMASQLASTV